jgi:hypothetical protein
LKKTLPVALGMIVGLYAVVEYFIPHYVVRDMSAHVFEWGGLIAAAAYVIGGINLIQVTWPKIRRREPDWQYKIVLLASAAMMAIVGLPWRSIVMSGDDPGEVRRIGTDPAAAARGKAIIELEAPDDVVVAIGPLTTTAAATPRVEVDAGPVLPTVMPSWAGSGTLPIKAGKRVVGYDALDLKINVAPGDIVRVTAHPQMRWGASGRFRTWIYDYVFAPCNATMFALLAFFVASAAFRAFRARNVESALLLGAAIIILVARAPMGHAISSSLPDIAQWILDIPSNGSRRAIIMGAAVGAIATGLRVILGLERSHLGGDS